jgi:hypothetical protein
MLSQCQRPLLGHHPHSICCAGGKQHKGARMMLGYPMRVGLIISFLLTLCGCRETRMVYEKDSVVVTKLHEFSKKGPRHARLALTEVTPFEWDAVYLFLEGSPKAEINRVVGHPIFTDPDGRLLEPGPLLVFCLGKQTVHAVVVLPPAHLSGKHAHQYRADSAVVEAYSKDPGPYALKFVE